MNGYQIVVMARDKTVQEVTAIDAHSFHSQAFTKTCPECGSVRNVAADNPSRIAVVVREAERFGNYLISCATPAYLDELRRVLSA